MFRDFQKEVKGDIELTKRVNKDATNFNEYVLKNKEQLLDDLHTDNFNSFMQGKVTS